MPEEEKIEEKTEEVQEEKEDTFFSKEGDTETFENLDTEEKKTPPDSSSEEKTEEESPASQGEESQKDEDIEKEEQIPFHKHPRWKQREKEWNERLEDLEANNEELRTQVSKKQETGSEPIPAWFSGVWGDNQAMWQNYQSRVTSDRESIKAEIYQELQTAQVQQEADNQKWDQWVGNELDDLKADGKKFNRNELLKVALDYKPTDDEGNISFSKAHEILETLKKSKGNSKRSQARKKLADATTSDSKAETKPRDFKTPEDLKGKDWFVG